MRRDRRSSRALFFTLIVLCLYLLFMISPEVSEVYGQTQSPALSSLGGRVLDIKGDAINDAIVSMSLLPSGPPFTVRTRSDGSFLVSGLRAGNYRVSVAKPGFAAATQDMLLAESEAQKRTFALEPVSVQASVTVRGERNQGEGPQYGINGLARMEEVQGMAIFAGKKNEVLILDGLNANLALGNTRQVFGKVPGANIWEIDSSGLQIGISNRGLDPNRSWEVNSRQNGYDITADIFGYPEAYFTPPLEAVERIEVVRGAASLQYGAQFGGLVNYFLKEAPQDRRFTFATEQTAGANGLFNSHSRAGGTFGKLTYNGYYHHRQGDGWRDNAGFDSNTGFVALRYQMNERLTIGFEGTQTGYLLQMAGGLTDELFNQNPRQSIRPGNWFYLNWLVPALKLQYDISPTARLSVTAFGLRGTRYSLFNSEPPAFPDGSLNINDPNKPRTLFKDRFRNHGFESRLLKHYKVLGKENTLALGFRYSNGKTVRQHGSGLAGVEANFAWLLPDVDRNLHFRNVNFAGFAENTFRVTSRLTVTPGLRLDYIHSAGRGAPIVGERKRSRTIPLFGLGVGYQLPKETSLYANISQAYRATLFNDFWRPDPFIIVDQNLKDMTGYVYEFGWRGRYAGWVHFDIGGFYLKYQDRLGLLTPRDASGQTVSLWTNVSDSRNVGIESFVEADMLRALRMNESWGSLSVFSSVALVNARYLGGSVRGNRVEIAPESIIRSGLTYRRHGLSATLQYNRVGDQFTDAGNTLFTVDAIQGLIPAYQVWDLSGSYQFTKRYAVRAGLNNLANERYFTRRAASYPGPGLIPADGRSFYASVGFRY